jgi:hypothetical protein
MAISTLEGVESVRVLRAAGNLKIIGTDRAAVEVDSALHPGSPPTPASPS